MQKPNARISRRISPVSQNYTDIRTAFKRNGAEIPSAQLGDIDPDDLTTQELMHNFEQAVKNLSPEDLRALCNHLYTGIVSRDKKIDRLYDKLNIDPLTGVMSYPAFIKKLKKLIEQIDDGTISTISILMGDLRGLKDANDNYSRKTGDNLLIATAQTMTHCIRKEDICGRCGKESDEFVVVLVNTDEADHLAIKERMDENFANTWVSGTITNPDGSETKGWVRLQVAFDIVKIQPGETAEEVLHRADAAMKEAKKEMKSREEFKLEWRDQSEGPPENPVYQPLY